MKTKIVGDFTISDNNILESFYMVDYLYSKTYDRLYKRVGVINHHNEIDDDVIPTILADTNDGMYDFISLKAENVYEVLTTPKNLCYKYYVKNLCL